MRLNAAGAMDVDVLLMTKDGGVRLNAAGAMDGCFGFVVEVDMKKPA